ncbi:hypothetical protein KW462_15150 [Vibrio fluvialis]|nr:hypothetical protein [Vibrio fluvialis]
MRAISMLCVFCLVVVTGCATPHRLGDHVAKIRSEQTYNPNATTENMEVIPPGNGERMEDVYNVYTGKKGEELKGSSTSQIIKGF